MTITLTIEEVKNYVSAMEHWQGKRAARLVELCGYIEMHNLDDNSLRATIRSRLAEWDLANPMPTLVSSHFGALVPKVTEIKATTKQG